LRLTKEDGDKYGIEEDERWRYVVVSDDKHNRTPAEKGTWFHRNSMELGNGSLEHRGDSVAALEPWSPPTSQMRQPTNWDIFEIQRLVDASTCRYSDQADDWVGYTIAEVLKLDPKNGVDKRRIKNFQRDLIFSKCLRIVEHKDALSKPRKFVVTGKRVVLDDQSGEDLI
jgi:hypothetical protein